jgi:hypothetical protein
MQQPSLFRPAPVAQHPNDPLRHAPPPSNGTLTSAAAAESMRGGKSDSLRERVYDWIAARGSDGATMDECEAAFNGWHSTISPRFWELAGNKGHERRIVPTDRKRPTRRGRLAVVYVAARRSA